MTLSEAFQAAQSERCDVACWIEAEACIVAAGLCPGCAQDDGMTPEHCGVLGPWESGSEYFNAGRACKCGWFAVCDQPQEACETQRV